MFIKILLCIRDRNQSMLNVCASFQANIPTLSCLCRIVSHKTQVSKAKTKPIFSQCCISVPPSRIAVKWVVIFDSSSETDQDGRDARAEYWHRTGPNRALRGYGWHESQVCRSHVKRFAIGGATSAVKCYSRLYT